MFTRPDDLSDAQLIDAFAASWGLRVDDIEYEAVGFGSHHWRVIADGEPWFVTADDLATKKRQQAEPTSVAAERLSAALDTAWVLRQAGLHFVVAPVRGSSGRIVEIVEQRFAVALYPFVDGTAHEWGSYPNRAERLSVLDVLGQVHAATELVRSTSVVEDFTIAHRDQLSAALAHLDQPWPDGPFGEPSRALVARHADAIRHVVQRRDHLAAVAAGQPERMVLTHGEPHRANTITTANGLALIDWDTAQIAPPERDLWTLVAEDSAIAEDYRARTGITLNDDVIELYRLSWDVAEIAIYIGEFRQSHGETTDTRTAWEGLQHHLDPARWHTSD